MKVACPECGKRFDVKNADVLAVAGKVVKKKVASQMMRIDKIGLRDFIYERRLSIRGFARMVGISSKTVDNWLRVERLSGVARKAIEGGLVMMALEVESNV